jgi:hypothetical protein
MSADNLVFDLLHYEAGTAQGTTDPATFACGGEDTFYTKSFELEKGRGFGLELGFDGTGAETINVKVELEQGNQAPATEGAADGNFVVTDELFAAVTSDAKVMVNPSVIVSTRARLKLTGLTGNHASVYMNRARWVRTKL